MRDRITKISESLDTALEDPGLKFGCVLLAVVSLRDVLHIHALSNALWMKNIRFYFPNSQIRSKFFHWCNLRCVPCFYGVVTLILFLSV